MPNKTFMAHIFIIASQMTGKHLKTNCLLKCFMLNVSFKPKHSQIFSLSIAVLTTKVNSSKGYLPVKFKSDNHILVAILGIQIPRHL